MLSNSFNWTQSQADLLRRAARCAPLWGASGKTAFYERGLFTASADMTSPSAAVATLFTGASASFVTPSA